MGPDSLYCSKWRKISKSRHDLDLGQTMPYIDLVQVIFIYYNVFKFHVPRTISLGAIVQEHTHTETHTHTDAHKDSDEYSIVAYKSSHSEQAKIARKPVCLYAQN